MRWFPLLALPILMAGTPPESTEAPEATDVHGRMATHLQMTERVRHALIAGDLVTAQSAAEELKKLDAEGMPDAWGAALKEVQIFAKFTSEAETVHGAAMGLSAVGQACADCHAQLEAGPNLTGTKVPAQEWGNAGHMKRHEWAATWMWLGVIKPDAAAFERGAKVLVEQPFYAEVAMAPDPTASRAALELQVHDIAEAALATTDAGDRADHYAELLGTCGKCHTGGEGTSATPDAPAPDAAPADEVAGTEAPADPPDLKTPAAPSKKDKKKKKKKK